MSASSVASSAMSADPHAYPPVAALTTIFTPTPAYCTTGISRFDTSICMPTGWTKYWASNVGYYSPAICPSGYTSACTRTSSGILYGPPVLPSETAIMCCPRYDHESHFLSYKPLIFHSSYFCDYTYLSLCASVLSSFSASSIAYAIQVRWQATDLVSFETDPGQAPRTASSTTLQTTSPISTGTSGLSTGAKIGIGCAVPLAVLITLFIGICLFLRHKRRRRRQNQSHDEVQVIPDSTHASVTTAKDAGYQAPPHYILSNKPELESTTFPVNRDNRGFSKLATNYMPSDNPAMYHSEGVPKLVNTNSGSTGTVATELPNHAYPAVTGRPPDEMDQMGRLREEQARLQERRRRLLMLEQIDEEEQRLRQQMAQIQGGSSTIQTPRELAG